MAQNSPPPLRLVVRQDHTGVWWLFEVDGRGGLHAAAGPYASKEKAEQGAVRTGDAFRSRATRESRQGTKGEDAVMADTQEHATLVTEIAALLARWEQESADFSEELSRRRGHPPMSEEEARQDDALLEARRHAYAATLLAAVRRDARETPFF